MDNIHPLENVFLGAGMGGMMMGMGMGMPVRRKKKGKKKKKKTCNFHKYTFRLCPISHKTSFLPSYHCITYLGGPPMGGMMGAPGTFHRYTFSF